MHVDVSGLETVGSMLPLPMIPWLRGALLKMATFLRLLEQRTHEEHSLT